MFDNSKAPVLVDYFLDPGYIYVTLRPAQISAVLGSCVAVCIHDRRRNISGMNHFQYPHVTDPSEATARYGNVATLALIRMMIREGSKLKHMEAQIFGGANNAKVCPKNIGRENVMAAKKVLARERVPLVSEDVGGEKGRKIVFDTFRNQVAVVRVDKIRKGDWYPYETDR